MTTKGARWVLVCLGVASPGALHPAEAPPAVTAKTEALAHLRQEFADPPQRHWPRPLWFWNDISVSVGTVREQMRLGRDRCRYGGFGILAALAPATALGQAYQSCGMIAGCGTVTVNTTLIPGIVLRGFSGCPLTCSVTNTNALACQAPTAAMTRLGGGFLPITDITARGCDFNCGGVQCSVRGADGLPVELMEFSVEPDESADAGPDADGEGERDSEE